MALHLRVQDPNGRERASDQGKRVISYVRFGGSRFGLWPRRSEFGPVRVSAFSGTRGAMRKADRGEGVEPGEEDVLAVPTDPGRKEGPVVHPGPFVLATQPRARFAVGR
jgi:hypothetical protein